MEVKHVNVGSSNPMFGRKGPLSAHWRGGTRTVKGHVLILKPEHPRVTSQGYVPRAILVWEEYYGAPFPVGKEPHHDNEIPDDDRPENIIPLTHSEHTGEHNRRRRKPL